MSLEAYRQSIVTAVEAARVAYVTDPTLLVEYDNRPAADPATQTKPYLMLEIDFLSGVQADISRTPIHRTFGQILLTVLVKEGAGTAKSLLLVEHFYKALQLKTFGDVHTKIATFVRPTTHLGNYVTSAIVPFYADTLTV